MSATLTEKDIEPFKRALRAWVASQHNKGPALPIRAMVSFIADDIIESTGGDLRGRMASALVIYELLLKEVLK